MFVVVLVGVVYGGIVGVVVLFVGGEDEWVGWIVGWCVVGEFG